MQCMRVVLPPQVEFFKSWEYVCIYLLQEVEHVVPMHPLFVVAVNLALPTPPNGSEKGVDIELLI